jgi:photosystem II stability/assembly factor-like uncharacterized protein
MHNATKIFTITLSLFIFNLFNFSFAQQRLESFNKTKQNISPFNGIKFRNIGPTIMSGRVTDLAVNPTNPTEFYVAYASGGVFHTTNNGLSFTPIFDNEATLTVGAIAMNWTTHTLWVGTGEVNSSRSSYAGVGIYKSSDTGKHWTYFGLPESHHIGKIVTHPTNNNIAWVAVLGHLYTSNNERGIYKTVDGGTTWNKTLYVNDSTGCVDLLLHPNNTSILYATSWTRVRHAWNFNGAGEGSAIWKSEDAGDTWKKISTGENGIPQGIGAGRITIAMSKSSNDIVYALIDNNFNQEEKKEDDKDKKIKARDVLAMTNDEFLKMDDKKIESYLKNNGYPEKYTATSLKEAIKKNKLTVKQIAEWKLADADNNLFDTPVYGAQLYKSNDGGSTWKKTHETILEGLFFTYGYYFGAMTVSPTNADKVTIAGYTCLQTTDAGKTFKEIAKENCHADYHRIWMNEKDDKHMIVGNDGGINITYNNGDVWYKANNPAVGQFYSVTTDDAKPYNVYGGLQDNGTWTASSEAVMNNEWQQSGINPYKVIGDGDGMQVQVDTRDNTTTYLGYQFGNYYRTNKNTGDAKYITPTYDIGEKPLRFNWQSPICLSRHNQDIVYFGSNCFHRSMNKGEDMKKMSADLTNTTYKGNVPFGTITSISESPLKFGLLLCGTDDGLIWKSNDVGDTWTNITNNLPFQKWCTRVVASAHKKERLYCTLNGYRTDDFTPYVYVSNDAGNTWTPLANTLPNEPINVIKEDPINENILYVGSDNGLYVCIDAGKKFMLWQSNLPRVAIHDIAIQKRENELVLGTHGRSIYIASLNFVQKLAADSNSFPLFIYAIEDINYNNKWGSKWASYADAMKPSIAINYYIAKASTIEVTIYSKEMMVLKTFTVEANYGINTINYDATITKKLAGNKADDGQYYLTAGNYIVEIKDTMGHKSVTELVIKEKKKDKE